MVTEEGSGTDHLKRSPVPTSSLKLPFQYREMRGYLNGLRAYVTHLKVHS